MMNWVITESRTILKRVMNEDCIYLVCYVISFLRLCSKLEQEGKGDFPEKWKWWCRDFVN